MDTTSLEYKNKMKARMAHARKSRPIKADNERVKTISISLRIDEIETLKQLGNGKLTHGIRNLLKNITIESINDNNDSDNIDDSLL